MEIINAIQNDMIVVEDRIEVVEPTVLDELHLTLIGGGIGDTCR